MKKKQRFNRKTGGRRNAERIYRKRVKPAVRSGRFFSTSSGGVFFESDDNGKLNDVKYFVDIDNTMGAMNGDGVVVKTWERDKSAVVTDITERAVSKVIGTLFSDERYSPSLFLEPDDSKIRFDISIIGSECPVNVSDGDKAEVRIEHFPSYAGDEPEGVITAVFGQSSGREANYTAVLHECGIKTEFDRDTLNEAKKCSNDIPVADKRLDLRSKFIFTIDGEDAKDLDDAISAERSEDGYILGVHIADVSHYVCADSALDREAFERGTSVYFVDKVVPMLPAELSNGICSLNPGMDRYALSAMIKLDKSGEIKGVKLNKSIINSKIRGVYSEVNRLIEGDRGEKLSEKYKAVIGRQLDLMLEIYQKLCRKSENRGALELDSEEARIILNHEGNPVEIVKRNRGTAEKLIEQFMLCANEAVALWLTNNGYPCVYRVHEPPEWEKCISFINFAHNLKLVPPYVKKGKITPAYFTAILDKARKAGIGGPVSYMLLRTMRKAKYSDKNSGHFGLSSECYCHFTSPIRRYPDLAVHRIVSDAIVCADSASLRKRYESFAADAARRSSENELKALEAERGIEELYKCLFLKDKIGQEYEAAVSSVTSFGLFCILENTCEGLVPISTMKNRYYFDAEMLTLSSGNAVYRLGDRVKIKVDNVDIATRKVDFLLVDEKENADFNFYRALNRRSERGNGSRSRR